MALTIPFPVIPIKITFGKEKETSLPTATSTGHDAIRYDSKDFVIVFLGICLIATVIALIAVSLRR
jgi:hypothetical protein